MWLADLATGCTLIACGLLATRQPGGGRTGALIAVAGVAWFLPNVGLGGLLYLHRGPLVHAVLTYPDGRIRGRLEAAAVAAGYVAAVAALWAGAAATFLLVGLMLGVAHRSRSRAVGVVRRMRAGALAATGFLGAVIAATTAIRLVVPTATADDATLLAYEAAMCALSAALLLGLIRRPWTRSRVTDLVVDLGVAPSASLAHALTAAVGDPTLEVGYRLGDRYVDAEGRPLVLPQRDSARRTTTIEVEGEPVAVLVHDAAVLEDPEVTAALARAAGLASVNARLQAEIRAQLDELRASRDRLVQAEDEERRRLERRLHQTTITRLRALGDALRDAYPQAEELVARSLTELAELGAGLDPGRGRPLGDALQSLAERAPVPVELTVPSVALPEHVGRAVYFVCSEALANAVKYADAGRVAIAVDVDGDRVRVDVTDDGRGGARRTRGGGLDGLADRVEALGGSLAVDSPHGAGTRVAAELPLDR